MIIKKIILDNIRSYKHEEINFSEGSTLLSGDIGSGKTSILLAIEFALFGLQPGQRGSALLRNGEEEGWVLMEFEVEGKKIVVERTLKRGKTVSQGSAFITIDREKKELSVTELKSKILDLLNYPREFSKKQNILYKFTVYTPQEEMKEIILQDPETRINTLRHVFGIDKYKRILENASIVLLKIREEKRFKEALILNLEDNRQKLQLKENELDSMKSALVNLAGDLLLKSDIRKKAEKEKDEIYKNIEQKNKFQQEIEKTKIMFLNKKEAIANNLRMLKELDSQIKEFQNLSIDESKIKLIEDEIKKLKKERESSYKENIEIVSKINSLNFKIDDALSLKSKMSKIEICPTCLQNVDPVYKANVVNKSDSDISNFKKEIFEFEQKKKTILENNARIDGELSQKEKELMDFKILKTKLQSVNEKKLKISEVKKTNVSLEKDISLLEKHTQILNQSFIELSKFDNLYSIKQEELKSAIKQERAAEIKVAELKREIEVFSKQIKELKDILGETEKIKLKLDYVSELENWLSKKFIPLISSVEKNVMANLKSEFSNLFAEWFSMLVSDSFNIRLDENFTPIVEQQDYELDYSYLSGGERTAIALAYRLALNQVINSIIAKIKTRDLVILDEPTDGFSEQQLDKMGVVFDQLKVRQLIIVSHEQKIESFVENVIKFKKEKGISEKI
jgi:exonuclease SbcC